MDQCAGEHFRTFGKRVRERLVELSNSNDWPFPQDKKLVLKQKKLIGKYERGELQPNPPPPPDDLPYAKNEGEIFSSWANRVRRQLTEISGRSRPYPRSEIAVNNMRRKIKYYQHRRETERSEIENLQFVINQSTQDLIYDYSLLIPEESISIRDMRAFFSIKKQHIIDIIKQHLHQNNERKQIKFQLTATGRFIDTQGNTFVRSFNHVFQLVLNDAEIDAKVDDAVEVILMKEDELQRSETGAAIDQLQTIDLKIVRYQPLRGGSKHLRKTSKIS